MNEIEKLYKLVGIPKCGKRQCKDSEYLECRNYCFCNMDNKCDKFIFEYLPFTPEKELKLIKWFAHSGHFSYQTDYLPWILDDIARHIVYLWDRYTDTEQAEIRKILEGNNE